MNGRDVALGNKLLLFIFIPLDIPNQYVMKRLLLVFAILGSLFIHAQTSFNINGETLSLYTEVEGELSLLWNSIDGQYRYFLKNGDAITELKNTKIDGKYQQEYKDELATFVGTDRVKKTRFTKPDLMEVIDSYNSTRDTNYESKIAKISLNTRLGGFLGITNYPYFINPDNTSLFQLGAEFEVMDEVKLKRHSLVFQFRHIFENSDYPFSSTQLMLNYRFKFIQTAKVDIYVNAKIAGYNYISQDIVIVDDDGDIVSIGGSGGEFQAPGAFGIGADIALGDGYLTFQYQDIVAINLDDNGDFPVDFAIGYKFNL